MARKREPRRARLKAADISQLLIVEPALAQHDERWSAAGYRRTRTQICHRKDGTFTARIVWRNREAAISTVSLTVQGETPF